MYDEDHWRFDAEDPYEYEDNDYGEEEYHYEDNWGYCPNCGAVLNVDNRMVNQIHCQRCQPDGCLTALFAELFFFEGRNPIDWFLG